MLSQPRLLFLRSKIMELQQALFFPDNDAVLKLPVSVINLIDVDDAGQLWFMVSRPVQDLNAFDKEFRAKLDFYKKGKNYYMHVRGRACIVNDPEEIEHIHLLTNDLKKLALTSMALIRMSVSEANYYPAHRSVLSLKPVLPKVNLHQSAFVKSLQYIVKDIIPVFQSH